MSEPIIDKVTVGKSRELPCDLYYEIHGNGPEKIVLIMGFATSAESWELQREYFSAQGRYQVLVFDNRGIGRSDAPDGLYTTSMMAEDTLELLDQLSWKEGVHVVGASMGGMIAQELAFHAPAGLVRTLTLTSTHAGVTFPSMYGFFQTFRALFAKDADTRARLNSDCLFPPAWLDAPAAVGSGFATNRDHFMDVTKKRILKIPIPKTAGIKGQLSAITRHRLTLDRLCAIREKGYPILVITGTEDYLVRPSNSHYLARELKARLEVFEGCGHVIPFQETERYNKLLLEHFGGC